jgi:hypothetical protein
VRLHADDKSGDEIASAFEPAVAQRPTRSEPDYLLEFLSETDSALVDGASRGQTPAPGAVDALLEFASDTEPPQSAPQGPLPSVYGAAKIPEPRLIQRWQPVIVRWVLPSAAAFLVGVAGVLLTLQKLESPRPLPAPVERAPRFDAAVAPSVMTGAASHFLSNLPNVRVGDLLVPPAPLALPPRRPAAARTSDPPPALRADVVPALDATTIAPIPVAARSRDLGSVGVEVARPTSIASLAAEESGVRRALHSYEAAYENLNVDDTVKIWPSVDRERLARAFGRLKSQGLTLDSCAITVNDTTATAYCRGTLRWVQRVGNTAPLSAEQRWTFTMVRADGEWKIDNVSATQEPVLAAQRTRGQG